MIEDREFRILAGRRYVAHRGGFAGRLTEDQIEAGARLLPAQTVFPDSGPWGADAAKTCGVQCRITDRKFWEADNR